MAAGSDVPHDLATFVIEQELGIEHGFWGCVAEGATFDSMGRRVTAEGRAVIRRYTAELAESEAIVNAYHFGWRAGEPTPVDAVLDATLAEWRALPEGAELVRRWHRTPVRRRGR
ncbi:MAG TPA: hypothetical protein VNQ73_11780 [Ilumatobacter sp.]|nr:hypothetical protein [Ilumatobacter sp.]